MKMRKKGGDSQRNGKVGDRDKKWETEKQGRREGEGRRKGKMGETRREVSFTIKSFSEPYKIPLCSFMI